MSDAVLNTGDLTNKMPIKIKANIFNIIVLLAVLFCLYYFFYPKLLYYWMKLRSNIRSYKIDLNFLYI